MGVKKMDIFLAIDSNNLDPDSGIIGFSRKVESSKNSSRNSTVKQPKFLVPTFLTRLVTQNESIPNMFSLFLGSNSTQSFIELAGSDLNSYSSAPSQAAVLSLNDSIYWQTAISGFSVGDYSTHSFSLNYIPVIFDTGSSVVLTPASMGTYLINTVLRGRYAWQRDGFYYTACDSTKLKSVYL
jgi:hypothetical protein